MFEGPVTGNIPEVLDNGEVTDASREPVWPFRKERPIQRAERGVHPVEVATAISRQKAVRDSNLVDGQPGVALQAQGLCQVYLEVAVRAGYDGGEVWLGGVAGKGGAQGSLRSSRYSMRSREYRISLSSCGSNKPHRESEKARKREFGIFFSGSNSLRPAAAQPQRQCRSGPQRRGPHEELHHKVEGRGAWRSVSAQHPQLLQVAPMSQRPRVVSVEDVDLVVEGESDFFLTVSTAILFTRLRSCAKAALRSLPSSTSRYSRCRTLVTAFFGTPLILRFSLRAPSGWTVRMLYILERRPTYSRILAGKVSSPSLPSWPITLMALARAASESALRPLSGSLDLPATSAVQVRLGHGVERVLQLEDLHHHGVGVREEQPHLWEEPPHVEVVGLLHHELGELQRAGANLGGHAHAGLAAVRLERLHKGQEPPPSR